MQLPNSRVRLAGAQPVVGQVRQNAGLDQIGNALGSFFDKTAQTAAQVRETEFQVELQQQQRRNEGLGVEGVADAAAGREMDPEKAQSYNYFSAFQRSAASARSAVLVNDFSKIVAAAPKDGSFDFDGAAKTFLKEKVGQTGEADHDATLLVRTTQGLEAIRGQHDEQVRQTVLTNNQNAFVAGATAKITSPLGFNAADLAEMRKDALALAQGNTELAGQLLFKGLTNGVVTERQQTAVMLQVYAPGPDGRSLADDHPDLALHISESARELVEKTRTVAAQKSLDQLDARLTNLVSGKSYDSTTVAELYDDIAGSANIHGAHAGHRELMHRLEAYGKVWANKKAKSALWVQAVEGRRSPSEMTRLTPDGEPISLAEYTNKHFEVEYDPYLETQLDRFPALLKSRSQEGLVRPTATKAAALEFATFAAHPDIRAASPEAVPQHHRAQFSADLLGGNVEVASNAYHLVRQVENLTKDQQYALKFLDNDESRRRYLAVRATEGSQLPEEALKRFIENPQSEADSAAIAKGEFKYSSLPGYIGTKEADAFKDLTARMNKQLREITGTTKWFGNGKDIGAASGRLHTLLLQGTADALREQARLAPGRVPDVDAAVKQSLALWKDRLMVLPGQHGTDLVVEDPFASRKTQTGKVYGDPVATLNGRPVFRFGEVRNAVGEVENTRDHFHTDITTLAKVLPDFGFKPENFSLGDPNSVNGTMEVRVGARGPLLLPLGKAIRMQGEGGTKTVTLPPTYHEALPILMQHLKGSGFVVEDPGVTYGGGSQTAVRLLYAPRIEKDAAWLAEHGRARKPAPMPTVLEKLQLPKPAANALALNPWSGWSNEPLRSN